MSIIGQIKKNGKQIIIMRPWLYVKVKDRNASSQKTVKMKIGPLEF